MKIKQILCLIFLPVAMVAGVAPSSAWAEYGDVVLNKTAEVNGMRPVIFPHWFHRLRFTCNVCHNETGFKLKAGSNDITMASIVDGQFCGMCHNGEIAWSPEHCHRCHSGIVGLKPGFYNGHSAGGPTRNWQLDKKRIR